MFKQITQTNSEKPPYGGFSHLYRLILQEAHLYRLILQEELFENFAISNNLILKKWLELFLATNLHVQPNGHERKFNSTHFFDLQRNDNFCSATH